MKNKKWKEFEKLTEKCYSSMIGAVKEEGCWDKAFEVLKEAIKEERGVRSGFAKEPYLLDEDTDYEYDILGWLEDYLDEKDMRREYEDILNICDELIDLFCWEEEKPSDIRFLKSSALGSLRRYDEALAYCEKWLEEEPDDMMAAAAKIYADIPVHDTADAEKLIRRYIQEDTLCSDENDIVFMAALKYYQATGNKKEEERMEQALEAYDEYLEELWMGGDDDDPAWDDGELPFF